MYSVALTDVGRKRLVNQDTVYISDTPVGVLPNLYIVADGKGRRLCVKVFDRLYAYIY